MFANLLSRADGSHAAVAAALLLIATHAPVAAADQQAPWPIPPGVKTVTVNGYPMAYTDTGSGEPIVLVHGALNDYRVWYAQVPEFSRRYRVIAISLRHYYPEKWDGQGSGFLIVEQADDVAALIKELGLQKVHLLGHSRGGAVVLSVAKRHPEVIKTLILEDASGLYSLLPETPEGAKQAAQAEELVKRLRVRLAAGKVERGAEEWVDSLSGPGAWKKRSRDEQQVLIDNMGTGGADTGERPPMTCADIERFDFPMLLMTAERSPKRFGESYVAMRACKPSIPSVVIIPNASHAMNRENPPAFNAVVLEFLERHGS